MIAYLIIILFFGIAKGFTCDEFCLLSSDKYSCLNSTAHARADLLNVFLRGCMNRVMVFIGDSVLHQLYKTLICMLCGLTAVSFTNGESIVRIHDPWNITFKYNWIQWGIYQHHTRSILSQEPKSAAVVVNFGLHYNEYKNKPPREHDRSDLVTHLIDLDKDISEAHSNIFFMETTPQHFSGSDNGYYNLNRGQDCVPVNNGTYRQDRDWRNSVLNGTLSKMKIIEVANRLFPLWSKHVGNGGDCTHWCPEALNLLTEIVLKQVYEKVCVTHP